VGLRDREGWPPAVCIWAGGMERPTVCIFGRASTQKEGCTACIPRPSRKATGSDAAVLVCDIGW